MNDSTMIEILLVEDNPRDAELIIRALKKRNLANNLIHVEDGSEALNFLFCRGKYEERKDSPSPKIVLLDLKLPKVDGLEVLRELKECEDTRRIPVVIVTSSAEDPGRCSPESWASKRLRRRRCGWRRAGTSQPSKTWILPRPSSSTAASRARSPSRRCCTKQPTACWRIAGSSAGGCSRISPSRRPLICKKQRLKRWKCYRKNDDYFKSSLNTLAPFLTT